MNFLAHTALAYDASICWKASHNQRKGLLAGAILGDFVKGRINPNWPESIQHGVWLHRKLDAASNRNPNVGIVSRRYAEDLRRYAPIFIDLLADYHLSHHWHTYHDRDIELLCEEVYLALAHYETLFSADGKRFCNYMVETNLLANYQQWSAIARGIRSVVRRLNARARGPNLDIEHVELINKQVLHNSESELLKLYADLQSELPEWNVLQPNVAPQN